MLQRLGIRKLEFVAKTQFLKKIKFKIVNDNQKEKMGINTTNDKTLYLN